MIKTYKALQNIAIFDVESVDTSDAGGVLISEDAFKDSIVVKEGEVFTIEETDEDEFCLDDGTVFGDEATVSNAVHRGTIILQHNSLT